MSPEALKALRGELKCTARELADALGLEQKTVLEWERGELYPTKQWVLKMEALRTKGPSAIPRTSRKKSARSGVDLLADETLWAVVRKLLAHPALFAAVKKLADGYDDPARP